MKIFNLKTQSTKALLLGALTLAPALALIHTAEAAPRSQAPVWNDQRFEQGRNSNRPNNNERFDNNRFDNRRQDNRRDDYRFESGRSNSHNDYRNDNRRDHDDNDTGKLLGAGIIGAIIGAVIAH